MRKVNTTVSPRLVAEYHYNGLGYRIGWHYDVDADGTVESTSDDPWYYFAYDDRWRIVATFRSNDTSPKERFVYHNAGDDGTGRSSYIDAVILRDKDANTAWSSASDGTLEKRIYYCQNWRADVVALIDDTDDQVEQVRYSSYGVPFGLLAGDADSDGDVDSSDLTQIQTWIDASQYDIRGDLDLDGDVDSTDKTTATNNSGRTLGWGVLSGVGNRKGYAGYELDDALAASYRLYHVRHRVLNADLGRWTRRDPLEYIDGANVYSYLQSNAIIGTDPQGMYYMPPFIDPGPGGGDDDDEPPLPQECEGDCTVTGFSCDLDGLNWDDIGAGCDAQEASQAQGHVRATMCPMPPGSPPCANPTVCTCFCTPTPPSSITQAIETVTEWVGDCAVTGTAVVTRIVWVAQGICVPADHFVPDCFLDPQPPPNPQPEPPDDPIVWPNPNEA